jgi:cysteinyl-tRNA synthetase
VIRFVLLGTHYGKPMDWTDEKVRDARQTLTKWYRQVGFSTAPGFVEGVLDPLADDLNTPEMIARCHALSSQGDMAILRGALSVLGLLDSDIPDWARVPGFSDEETGIVRDLILQRDAARRMKDYAKADAIRAALNEAGIVVRDTSGEPEFEKTSSFDLDALNRAWPQHAS